MTQIGKKIKLQNFDEKGAKFKILGKNWEKTVFDILVF